MWVFVVICLFVYLIIYLWVWVFYMHICLCTMYMQYPWSPEEGIRFSRTGVKDGCELPYGCWESNLSSPGEQPVPLTSP